MIQQIDFLPASYRQKRQTRQKKRWRQSLLIAFFAITVLGTVQQRFSLYKLQKTRDGLQSHADRMVAQLDGGDALRAQIHTLETKANLVTMLRVDVPATRILAAVTNSLPPFVTLNKVEWSRSNVGSSSMPLRPNEKDAAPVRPEEADFAQLKQEAVEGALQVNFVGVAPDDVAISSYLSALHDTKVFADVQLLYTDHYEYHDNSMRIFGVRLLVRKPGGLETQPSPQEPNDLIRQLAPLGVVADAPHDSSAFDSDGAVPAPQQEPLDGVPGVQP